MKTNSMQTYIPSLFCLVLGLCFAIFDYRVLVWAVRAIAICGLLYGIYELYLYFSKKEPSAPFLVMGCIASIGGAFLLLFPTWLINLFPIVIGMGIVIISLYQMIKAMSLKSIGDPSWSISLILSVAMLIAALFLIFTPSRSLRWIVKAAGIALIIEGLFSAWQAYKLGQVHKL